MHYRLCDLFSISILTIANAGRIICLEARQTASERKGNQMNKREAYAQGYARGWNGASWVDMPEIGATLSRAVDWIGLGTVETVEDQIEAWEMMCGASEENDRSFSPFEFTAHAINTSRDPEGYWEAFDAGIYAGRAAYRRKHYPLKTLRRWAREDRAS